MKKTKEQGFKFNIKNNKGITLISLVITIAVMLVIASVTVNTSMGRFEINRYKKLINDLELLQDKVQSYYLKYGGLPILRDGENNPIAPATNLDFDKNEKDNSNYYIIDLEAMENLVLNYGKGFENYTDPNEKDLYVINEGSHTIYYIQGVGLSGTTYYYIEGNEQEITDNIPPTKPQIKIISGTKNEEGVYTTAVELEFVPGKDNTSGIEKTTYSINDGEETNINTLNDNILKLEKNEKYEVKVKSYDNNDNVSDYNVINIEIKIISAEKGDFIEYNVGYTDMYIAKDYTPQNGWRLMDYTNNGNGTYTNVKIISTGIPAKLSYDYSDTINNSWYITDETKLANFREILGGDEYEFFTGTYDYIGLKAAAGLYYNFADIKFAYATEERGDNLGYFNSIINDSKSYNSTTTEEITGGDLFLTQRSDMIVRLSTLTEMNRYLKRTDIDSKASITEVEDQIGLYDLNQVHRINGMQNYIYNGVSDYWLASPTPKPGIYMTSASYLQHVYSVNIGGTISGDYGIRPVICFSNNVQFVDENNDGILEIK